MALLEYALSASSAAGRRLRPRGRPAPPVAGRGVRDRAEPDSSGGPVWPGDGPAVSLLGPGPADRAPGRGRAARLGAAAVPGAESRSPAMNAPPCGAPRA